MRLNQIQVVGTHNSYRAGFAPSEAKLLQMKYPEPYKTFDYQHQSLSQQLDAGVRQIEIDIFSDVNGGRYAKPLGPQIVSASGLPPDPPFDSDGVMKAPGFKVMHIQDFDYRSSCQPFTACLNEVRAWSKAHPEHVPIFILVETKQDSPLGLRLTTPEPFTSKVFDALDAELRSVFQPGEMIVPDDVRQNYKTLNEAVLAHHWPTLESTRGKVMFLMDHADVSPVYLEGHPSLRGRVIFTNSQPGAPDSAFVERNDSSPEDISLLVTRGYLVRTRSDVDTREARSNDTSRRDAMMRSGAQIVSTDYPASEPARWPGAYSVSLPNHAVARCNPVNGEACDKDFESDPRN